MHGSFDAKPVGPRALAAAICLTFLLATDAARAEEPINAVYGLAIGGYDTVAYFRDGRARAGSARFLHIWHGAVWFFATRSNRDAFAAEPRRYAPRYGGFSAYSVSDGELYAIDPSAFLIVDGRLYLHANHHVRRLWAADLAANIARADAGWRRVLDGSRR